MDEFIDDCWCVVGALVVVDEDLEWCVVAGDEAGDAGFDVGLLVACGDADGDCWLGVCLGGLWLLCWWGWRWFSVAAQVEECDREVGQGDAEADGEEDGEYFHCVGSVVVVLILLLGCLRLSSGVERAVRSGSWRFLSRRMRS